MHAQGYTERWTEASFVRDRTHYLKQIFEERVCDAGVDLRGLAVGLDGPLEMSTWGDFVQSRLANIDLSYSRFSCAFSNGTFDSVSFAHSLFDTCRFGRGSFQKCDFAESRFDDPSFDDAVFDGCSLRGAQLHGRGYLGYGGRRARFHGCDLTRAVFFNLKLRACGFSECTFDGAVFRKCVVAAVKFLDGPVRRDQFEECTLQGENVGIE